MTSSAHDHRVVIERLATEGISCDDVYSLQKQPAVLRRAAPLLLELVAEVSSPQVKTDLIRVASSAKISPKVLVSELQRLRPQLDHGAKPSKSFAQLSGKDLVAELTRLRSDSSGVASVAWALADALRDCADESVYEDLVDILRDPHFGRARQMIPYALANVTSRKAETIQVLLDVLEDADITPQVIDTLAKLKAVQAISLLRPYLEAEKRLVRTEAKKALQTLEKLKKKSARGPRSDHGENTPKDSRLVENLVETSANFDIDEIPELLAELSHLVDGLLPSEIERIETRLEQMDPGENAIFNTHVEYDGALCPIQIRIHMSDVGAPDMAFLTEANLAEAIDQLIEGFG